MCLCVCECVCVWVCASVCECVRLCVWVRLAGYNSVVLSQPEECGGRQRLDDKTCQGSRYPELHSSGVTEHWPCYKVNSYTPLAMRSRGFNIHLLRINPQTKQADFDSVLYARALQHLECKHTHTHLCVYLWFSTSCQTFVVRINHKFLNTQLWTKDNEPLK